MSRVLAILTLTLPWILKAGEERPSRAEVAAVVEKLGAAGLEAREGAQRRLEVWTEAYPRFMLDALVEAYAEVRDVEVELRLREVLRPPAMLYLFNGAPGFMGVNLEAQNLEDGRKGIGLRNIHPGLAADKAGLRAGDVVVSLEGRTFEEMGGVPGFSDTIAASAPGSLVEMAVRRGEREFSVRVKLVVRPEHLRRSSSRRQDRQKQFQAWLRDLRPGALENGIPVGHHPEGPAESESPPSD